MRITLTIICLLLCSLTYGQYTFKYSTTIGNNAYAQTLEKINKAVGTATSEKGKKKVWFLKASNFESTIILKGRKLKIVYDGDDGADREKLEKLYKEISANE